MQNESLEEHLWVMNNFHVTANDKNEAWADKDVAAPTSQLLS